MVTTARRPRKPRRMTKKDLEASKAAWRAMGLDQPPRPEPLSPDLDRFADRLITVMRREPTWTAAKAALEKFAVLTVSWGSSELYDQLWEHPVVAKHNRALGQGGVLAHQFYTLYQRNPKYESTIDKPFRIVIGRIGNTVDYEVRPKTAEEQGQARFAFAGKRRHAGAALVKAAAALKKAWKGR